MSLALRFDPDTVRHPGRHEVVDAWLASDAGEVPVVVKKVPITARQRLAGLTKGERALRAARAIAAAGASTPEPLGVEERGGESWYVCRKVEGAEQIRSWFWRRSQPDRPAPRLDASFEEVLDAVARLARRIHDGGVFFRDFTDGNVLVTREEGALRLWLVDLDRARVRPGPLPALLRMRDLSRLGLNRAGDRKRLLASYFAPAAIPAGWEAALTAMRLRIRGWDASKRLLRPWKW